MNTIDYFYEISKIPRQSGNEAGIAQYLCDFAKKRNLNYTIDKYNNVIITKYGNFKNTIILQAHTDMVCEKALDYDFNFTKDSIKLIRENGYITANNTTLGADNGIAIAEILNILDKDYSINIEAVFTVSEETSMIGAEKIDISHLKGNYLINMDGFEESTLIKESASFNDVIIRMNYSFISNIIKENQYQIHLFGLEGGHSGFDIDNNKGNSGIILSNILSEVGDIKLSSFSSGTKLNVIPSEALSSFYTKEEYDSLMKLFSNKISLYQKHYPNLQFELVKTNIRKKYLSNKESIRFISSIKKFKNGVFNKKEYVTTSQNLGIVNLQKNELGIGVRSSRLNEEENILNYLKEYSKSFNYELNIIGRQPGYCTQDDKFIKLIMESYQEVTGKKMIAKGVHITLETGFFMNKNKNLSIAVISPRIENAHSIKERVYEKSVFDISKTMDTILKRMADK